MNIAWWHRLSAPTCFPGEKYRAPPKITVSCDGRGIVFQTGALLLSEALRVTSLDQALTAGLARWGAPRAVHDPGKIIADLVMTLALGGDCLADIAVLRSQPGLAGPVASDPVVSRPVTALAADAPRALRAIRKARAATRSGPGHWPVIGHPAQAGR
jgi:Transposase DDE domain group 1